MERIWYYASGGERRGPQTDSEMKDLITQGAVTPSTLVWSEGMTEWLALSASALGTSAVATAVIPPPTPHVIAPGQVPEGLRGWMQFCGIMMIIGGALQSLSCIGAVFGIPMIIAGVAFTGAASQLDKLGGVDARMADLLVRLRSGFKATGVGIIISMVLTLIVLFVYLIIGVALLKAFATSMGAPT